ncbi:hypothetical protein ACHRVZ_16505 [Flavobacterium sp. FlaQc-57]|uniref:hypothetical protein n=1 Tax=Flavobacterium sp. FlaQc-57 TaxID=3374186 RepID=UPI00375665A6
MNLTELPIDLKKLIENEKVDFLTKAKRKYPLSKTRIGLFFACIWCSFVGFMAYALFGPLLRNEEVHFTSNDVPVTASWEDLSELLVPGLIIGLFAVIGLILLFFAIKSLFQKGSYFVGTETRLIQYYNGKSTITDWEQFTGNVKIESKNNLGDLEYELRTGKMQSQKNQADKFVPDIIYISGIENVYDIEKKCKIRIKENDPTPVVLSH